MAGESQLKSAESCAAGEGIVVWQWHQQYHMKFPKGSIAWKAQLFGQLSC